MDFHTANSDEVDRKLRKFYCEAKPKDTNKSYMMDAQTGYYHKTHWKNIRSAINRHLNDIDISRYKEFKPANQTLDVMLKLEHQDPQNTKRSSIQRICPNFFHIYGQPSYFTACNKKPTAYNDGTTAYNNKPTAYNDVTRAFNKK